MKKIREGEIRCLNCFSKFKPEPKAEKATCPKCGIRWRISWVHEGFAKIRGPVWEVQPTRLKKREEGQGWH